MLGQFCVSGRRAIFQTNLAVNSFPLTSSAQMIVLEKEKTVADVVLSE